MSISVILRALHDIRYDMTSDRSTPISLMEHYKKQKKVLLYKNPTQSKITSFTVAMNRLFDTIVPSYELIIMVNINF